MSAASPLADGPRRWIWRICVPFGPQEGPFARFLLWVWGIPLRVIVDERRCRGSEAPCPLCATGAHGGLEVVQHLTEGCACVCVTSSWTRPGPGRLVHSARLRLDRSERSAEGLQERPDAVPQVVVAHGGEGYAGDDAGDEQQDCPVP